MKKFFLPILIAFAALFFSACNPLSYFMLYGYSSAEKPDDIADRRMTELEEARAARMRGNPNYRDAEIEAYNRARGITTSPENLDTRPVSTEELRKRMEKQARERRQ
ncbi:MAG: hypothetical protein IKM45_02100 [Opitutales bacterium]|nr:hypothetical protein [Opitutales bacterium]